MNCEFEKASRQFQRAFGIVEKANNQWAMSRTKSYLSFFCYFFLGKIDLAWQTGREAIRLAEDSGDMYSRAMAYASRGIAAYGKGFFKEATDNLVKGASFCETLNYVIWNGISHWFLGETYCEMGEYQNSRDSYERTAQLLDQSNSFFSFNDQMKMGAILAKVLINKDEEVDLRLLYQWVDSSKLRLSEAGKRMYIGQILLSMNDHYLTDAENWIRNAIEATTRNAMIWYVARNYGLLAEALRRKGDVLQARENLARAIDIYKGCGADGWVTKAEEELARLA
jgi:tetratricopeptide (TPR) repeat protein